MSKSERKIASVDISNVMVGRILIRPITMSAPFFSVYTQDEGYGGGII